MQNEALPQGLGTTLDHSGGEPQAVRLQLRMPRTKICLQGVLPVPACCRTVCALSPVNPTAFLPACSSMHTAREKLGHGGVTQAGGENWMCRGCRAQHSTTRLTEHSCSSSWWVCCQSYGSSLIAYAPAAYAERLLLAE